MSMQICAIMECTEDMQQVQKHKCMHSRQCKHYHSITMVKLSNTQHKNYSQKLSLNYIIQVYLYIRRAYKINVIHEQTSQQYFLSY